MKEITTQLLGFAPKYSPKSQKIDPSYTCRWDDRTFISMPKRFLDDVKTWIHEFTEMAVFDLIDEITGVGSNHSSHLLAGFSCGAGFRMDRFNEPVKYLSANQYWKLFKLAYDHRKSNLIKGEETK